MADSKIIVWIDSALQDVQVDKKHFPKPVVVRSVGFVVDETEEFIILARDDMGEGDYRGLLAIPKVSIL